MLRLTWVPSPGRNKEAMRYAERGKKSLSLAFPHLSLCTLLPFLMCISGGPVQSTTRVPSSMITKLSSISASSLNGPFTFVPWSPDLKCHPNRDQSHTDLFLSLDSCIHCLFNISDKMSSKHLKFRISKALLNPSCSSHRWWHPILSDLEANTLASSLTLLFLIPSSSNLPENLVGSCFRYFQNPACSHRLSCYHCV